MTTSETPGIAPEDSGQEETLAPLDLRSLFVAGVHFGHPSKRWNPKMAQYIFGKRSRAHIIDLSQTVTMLKTAKDFVEEIVAKGGECLMVGTKAQAQGAIKEQANSVGAMYINQRWLGGMMTNFQTIQARIERLIFLEDAFAKGTVVSQTKRESLMLSAEVERLNKFFGGIKEMVKLPQVLFIVDIEKENIAVSEARRLGIPIVAIVDTNCDPTQVDYAIPGNDDSVRSITLIARHIAEAISKGKIIAKAARDERMAAEAELEAQEAAARAEAQAKAAERAAEAAKEKAVADAARAAEAKKADAETAKAKDEASPASTVEETGGKPDVEVARSEADAEKAAPEAKDTAKDAKAESAVETPEAKEKVEVQKVEDAKVADTEAKAEPAADAVVAPESAKTAAKTEEEPAAEAKPATKAKAAPKKPAATKAKTAPKTKAKAATKASDKTDADDKKSDSSASK